MAKRNKFFLIFAGFLLLLSGVGYYIHYLIFRDTHHIFIYMVHDIAFLPLEVLIVGLIIERFMSRREKQHQMQKLNMVIGVFFSDVGNELLGDLLGYFRNRDEITRQLNVKAAWTRNDFQQAVDFAYHLPVDVDYHNLKLAKLKELLAGKREFLLTLLENPSLLENDRFTDLLWAVTHLDEELKARASFDNLPEADLIHIAGDIQRMYDHLASEWLDYIQHLKVHYPYLYSLVLRTHPFQEQPSPLFMK